MDKGRLAVAGLPFRLPCWGSSKGRPCVIGPPLWNIVLCGGVHNSDTLSQFVHSWGMQVRPDRPDTDSVAIHYIILIPLLLLVQHERFCLGCSLLDHFEKEHVFV